MRRDSITLLDLDDRGHDLRAWCFDCARGQTFAIYTVRRFAHLDLVTAARRFTCVACDRSDRVALFPARRRHKMPNLRAKPADPDRIVTATDVVAAFFFSTRAAAKAAKRDPGIERTAAQLKASLQAKKNAPKRVPTKPVKLTIVGTKTK